MHPAFEKIEFGPFRSEYHNEATTSEFQKALDDYLTAELLPQVNEPFDSTFGRLLATYDDPKYCGPNSAVRDIYSLEFEFRRSGGVDAIKIDLTFSTNSRSFSPRRRGQRLYLWTRARKEAQLRRSNSVKDVCERILSGDTSTTSCPCCGSELRIHKSPELFDVSCPAFCFRFNFHRDPLTGAFQHGHSIVRPQMDT